MIRGQGSERPWRRWLRQPAGGLLSVRTATTMLRRLNAAEQVPARDLAAAARAVHALGLRPMASALLHHPGLEPVGPGYIVLARRRLGVSRPATAAMVHRAYTTANGPGSVPSVISEPIAAGRGWNVEAVVRHRFPQADFSMIRKTIHGPRPVELSAYTSDLFDCGTLFRVPCLYHHASDQPGRWHLFLEDLGHQERVRRAEELLVAARALGELNGIGLDQPDLARGHPWLRRGTWKLPSFTELGERPALSADLPDELASRLRNMMSSLAAHEPQLLSVQRKAPLSLRHGDANCTNVVVRDGESIFFDLSEVRVGLLGRDLGNLLGLPTTIVNRDQGLVDACLAAYLEGIERAGSCPDPHLVAHVYRMQFVRKSLWNMLKSAQRRQEIDRQRSGSTAPLSPTTAQQHQLAIRINRICDEGERMIQQVA